MVHTHGGPIRHGTAIVDINQWSAEDRIFAGMPFFWVGGSCYTVISAMLCGATMLSLERFDLVWLVLIMASLAAWEISPGSDERHGLIIGQINIALGFAKAWLIGWEFMELQSAPRLLQVLLGAWAGIVGAAIIVLYSI